MSKTTHNGLTHTCVTHVCQFYSLIESNWPEMNFRTCLMQTETKEPLRNQSMFVLVSSNGHLVFYYNRANKQIVDSAVVIIIQINNQYMH